MVCSAFCVHKIARFEPFMSDKPIKNKSLLFERIKAENTATAALVQNLRDAISTKDSLIESLKKDIGANEEQTKKVFFFIWCIFIFARDHHSGSYQVNMWNQEKNDV